MDVKQNVWSMTGTSRSKLKFLKMANMLMKAMAGCQCVEGLVAGL